MKRNNVKDVIKEYFCLYPTIKLRVRQIERKLSLSLPSVIRYTKELEEENFLKSIQIAGIKLYSADRASTFFLLEKKLFNIRSLFLSGLINHLIKEFDNPTVIIFGSYSKGEDVEKSDLDIYLETLKKEEIDLTKFEKKLKRKIQLFKYKKISEIKNKELANNILNGTTLNGFIEVF